MCEPHCLLGPSIRLCCVGVAWQQQMQCLMKLRPLMCRRFETRSGMKTSLAFVQGRELSIYDNLRVPRLSRAANFKHSPYLVMIHDIRGHFETYSWNAFSLFTKILRGRVFGHLATSRVLKAAAHCD